jgi:hypothetical protein
MSTAAWTTGTGHRLDRKHAHGLDDLAERHSAQVRADPQDQLVLAADIIAGGKPADFRCFRCLNRLSHSAAKSPSNTVLIFLSA